MVSDASKKREAQKKAAAAAKRAGKSGASSKAAKEAAAAATATTAAAGENGTANDLASGVGALQISDRTCTGVLCSHPLSRDIRVRVYSRSIFKDPTNLYNCMFKNSALAL